VDLIKQIIQILVIILILIIIYQFYQIKKYKILIKNNILQIQFHKILIIIINKKI
jgi:hypothetical protein